MNSTLRSSVIPSNDNKAEWLNRGLILLLALVAANLLAWRTIDPDLWGHIQYGEDWIHEGSMPRTATHTYSAVGHPWINHENLFELAVAAGQRTIGGVGLMVFKCLAGIWLLWTMVCVARRRGVSTLAASVTMLAVALGLAEFCLARPQMFSFLNFGLMLMAFERAFRDWRSGGTSNWTVSYRWLWLCVPLMIFWTNSHGGFAAGLCVFLAIVGLRSIEILWHKQRAGISTVLHLSLISVAMIGSIFVNPYGYELPYWMFVSLSQPRPEISDWNSLWYHTSIGGVTIVPFLVLTILTGFSLIWTKARRDWVELIVLGLVAVQTLGHIRHLPFFAIVFGYWMPQHVVSMWNRFVSWRSALDIPELLTPTGDIVRKELADNASRRNTTKRELAKIAVVAVLCIGMLAWSFGSFGVDRSEYPVDTIEFMAKNNLNGKLVVTFNWAQYALAALAPRTTVGFDGRYDTCYPQVVVDIHFDLLFGQDSSRRHRGPDSGPIDQHRALEFCNPDLVLMDREYPPEAVDFINTRTEWVVLYEDALAILWGRSSVYDDPTSPRYFPKSLRVSTDRMPSGIAVWPGFPNRTGRNAFHRDVAAAVQQAFESAADARDKSTNVAF